MSWILQAINGDLDGQQIQIDRDMLVGRHQAADIVLQAAEISRKHAGFTLQDENLWLQDLSSSNGTFVNDQRISEQTQLKADDIVQFASIGFKVIEVASEATTPVDKSVAEQMNEQGMPELKERDGNVQVNRDGMPSGVAVPKPAPIPEGVDVSAVQRDPSPVFEPEPMPEQPSLVEEQQKNTTVGLMTVIAIIIIAILAFVFLK